jgi:hypothetical protein
MIVETDIKYKKKLISSFLLKCREDGGMSIAELQRLADSVGVKHSENMLSEVELIRKIQEVSNHSLCFQTDTREQCKESKCQWRSECRKLIASWSRT